MCRSDSLTVELLREGWHLNSSGELEAPQPHTVPCVHISFFAVG